MFKSIQKRMLLAFLMLFAAVQIILSVYYYHNIRSVMIDGFVLKASAVSAPVFSEIDRKLSRIVEVQNRREFLEIYMDLRSSVVFPGFYTTYGDLIDLVFVNHKGNVISYLGTGLKSPAGSLGESGSPPPVELDRSIRIFVPYRHNDIFYGGMVITFSKNKILSEQHRLLSENFILFILLLLGGGLSVNFLSRTIVRPIKRLTVVFDDVAKGNFSHSVDTDRRDELGELARSFESMRVTIGENMQEIDAKNSELKQAQKMEMTGLLAGGIAHDFNNDLAVIKGCSSLIDIEIGRDNSVGKLAGIIAEYNEMIKDSVLRSTSMVKQMLSLSTDIDIDMVPVNLNDSIQTVMKICRNTFDRSVALINGKSDMSAYVNGDPLQIEQALLNLCFNANHAMTIMRSEGEEQGGTLSLSVDKSSVEDANIAEPGEYWRITVSDTGVGIDEDQRKSIFDPFFTTKEKGVGTGLGLAMVYNSIKHHKGFITVESHPGRGSDFNIFLPAADCLDIIEDDVKNPAAGISGSGLILVVDDEISLRKVAGAMLRKCGYDVVTAENGQQCVDIFRDRGHEISAVILDMDMPGKSGKKVYAEIKDIDGDARVVLSSGFRKDDQVESLMRMGVKVFLQKPYSIDEIVGALRKVGVESDA